MFLTEIRGFLGKAPAALDRSRSIGAAVNRDLPRKPPDWTVGVIFVVGTAAVLGVVIEAAVTRDLQNDLPDWAVALIFVGGTLIVVLDWVCSSQPTPSCSGGPRSTQVLGGVAAMVMTMFAVLLAFVIVNLYNSYDGAVNNVAAEATSLTELVEDAGTFPPVVRRRIERAVAEYVVRGPAARIETLRNGTPTRGRATAGKPPRSRPATRRSRPLNRRLQRRERAAAHDRERAAEPLDAAHTAIPKPCCT